MVNKYIVESFFAEIPVWKSLWLEIKCQSCCCWLNIRSIRVKKKYISFVQIQGKLSLCEVLINTFWRSSWLHRVQHVWFLLAHLMITTAYLWAVLTCKLQVDWSLEAYQNTVVNLVSCILCEAFWVCTGHIILKETYKWNQNGPQPLQKHCWVIILSDLLSYLHARLWKDVSFCHLSGVFSFCFYRQIFLGDLFSTSCHTEINKNGWWWNNKKFSEVILLRSLLLGE